MTEPGTRCALFPQHALRKYSKIPWSSLPSTLLMLGNIDIDINTCDAVHTGW